VTEEAGNASFQVAATGTPTPTFTWERSADGNAWSSLPGATKANLTFVVAASDKGARFRAIARNSEGAATSNAAMLTVTSPFPVISNFTANPLTIQRGGASTLSWSVTGATRLTVDGIGEVTGTSLVVRPSATSIYALTASNGTSSVSAQATVTVVGQGVQITQFQAADAVVPFGSLTTLSWALNEDPLSLKLDGLGVSGLSATVNPVRRQTYTLSASNLEGSDSRSLKVAAQGMDLLAGHGEILTGSVDGTGAGARFAEPGGIAADSAGNLYVADGQNHTIRKITSQGVVTTLAGLAGERGALDGPGALARFNDPSAVAVDPAGNIYVADTGNMTIRKITPAGVVTTLAGLAGTIGATNGTSAGSRFNVPQGIALDGAGNCYVGDTGNSTIRKITPAGVVSTLAGSAGQSGSADGAGSTARFNGPTGLAVDGAGTVYVADLINATIRKITPAGMVTTLAGVAGSLGFADGMGASARFSWPNGLAFDGAGNLYVADSHNGLIRKVAPSGEVTSVAGVLGSFGPGDGPAAQAHFSLPGYLAVDSAGVIYVADGGNCLIRKITPDLAVSTLAGTPSHFGFMNGAGQGAYLVPTDLARDAAGNLFVADVFEGIHKVTPAGVVTTLVVAGGSYQPDPAGGGGESGTLGALSHLAVDASGNVFGYDSHSKNIHKITQDGRVTTFAQAVSSIGGSMAVDSAGNVVFADFDRNAILKISPSGEVTTLAGGAGGAGFADGPGSSARFNFPRGVAFDAAWNLYVADRHNHVIRKITPDGTVTTLAGMPGTPGFADGNGSAARFNEPIAVAADAAGNVFVSDDRNRTIRRITPDGVVRTVAGTPGVEADPMTWNPGPLPGSLPSQSWVMSLAVTAEGDLLIPSPAGIIQITAPVSVNRGAVPSIRSFTVSPATIDLGQDITLAWDVTGATSVSIDNGVGVVTGTTITLKPTKDSTYTLTASCAAGSAMASAGVIVRLPSPPVFTSHPTSITVNEGTVVTFSAAAEGNPAPTMSWVRAYQGAGMWLGVPGSAGKSPLSFTAAYSDNGYQYKAMATNAGGAVSSQIATLTVIPNLGTVHVLNQAQSPIVSLQMALVGDAHWGASLTSSVAAGGVFEIPALLPSTYLMKCVYGNGIKQAFVVKVLANQTEVVMATGQAEGVVSILNQMLEQNIVMIVVRADGRDSANQLSQPMVPRGVVNFWGMAPNIYEFHVKRDDGKWLVMTVSLVGGDVFGFNVSDTASWTVGVPAGKEDPQSLPLLPLF
jgi:sugar lactone lactonase YvrE